MSQHTPITIGLSGRAGSGKDTVRHLLETRHGFAGLAYADPIRGMLRELLRVTGSSDAYIIDRHLKEAKIPGLGVSYRVLAQTLGTEWGRMCLGSNFWVRAADATCGALRASGHPRLVISDVRFANEAAHIRTHGGLVWHIDRLGLTPVAAHVSEDMPFLADRTIANNGTQAALAQAVAAAVQAIGSDVACRVSTLHALGGVVAGASGGAA